MTTATLTKNEGAELVAASATPTTDSINQILAQSTSLPWTVQLENFPEQLRAKPVWCIWRYEVREDKPTKVPCQPGGAYAKSNDPATWVTFEEACAAADGDPEYGVGIFCDGTFTFVDVDHCRDENTGNLDPWAKRVLNRVGGYQELSPSHTGLHAFVEGAVTAAVKKNGVEMYSKGRFATVTGEGSGEYRGCAALEQIRADVAAGKLGKGAITASKSRSGLTLEQLEAGESPANDASEGDYQYVALLAEEGLTDEQIDERFRASARMRDKWDRNAGGGQTYGERTVAKVRATQAAEEAKGNIDPDDWRSLFHTYEETVNAPPLTFAIDGFLQEAGITFFGGLAGHGKTLIMLNVVKALLEGEKLWNHFKVNGTSKRVLYLVPESGLGPFVYRLKLFGLLEHVKAGRLFYRTLSARDGMRVALDDPRILRAAEGADVFLDTAIRFMTGEENSASDHRAFADLLFNLQGAGARTISGAHHSPKNFETREAITLENALRGSGDVGAMLATCWAVKQINAEANRLFVKNAKARDFDPCKPFELEGRPWIDQTGAFKMTALPGSAVLPIPTQKANMEKWDMARALRRDGNTLAQIAEKLKVTLRTVERWSTDGKLDWKKPPTADDGTGMADEDLPFETAS